MRIRLDFWLGIAIFFALLPVVIGVSLLLGAHYGMTPSTHDLGLDVLIEAIFVILTVFAIGSVLGLSERTRWRRLRDTVLKMLFREVSGIETDLAFMLLPPTVRYVARDLPKKESTKRLRDARQAEIEELEEGDVGEIATRVEALNRIASGDYGLLFKHRAENVGTFVDRYSAHLEPDLQAHLIVLEDSLRQVNRSVNIAMKFREDKRPLAQLFANGAIETLAHDLWRALRTIMEIRKLGVLGMK